jgi:glycerate dehydrogenase
MNETVFLNAAKLNFDAKLDFAPLTSLTHLTSYADSTDAEIVARVQGETVVITKELPVGKALIDRFPGSVKLICEAGTGYNNLDIAAARARGIAVCNVPTYSTEAVAQLALTFMLNLSCSLPQQVAMLQRKDFTNFTKQLQVLHFELQGKTLGVIGGGAIGRKLMWHALNLGMKVVVHDIVAPRGLDPAIGLCSLEELLAQSDFISLHCPLNAATRHLIDERTIGLMKPGACLINTSRGAIVDEPALIAALEAGRLGGAGLDVQEREPLAPDSPLFGLQNVIVTPHIGWRRLESRQRLIKLTAENIAAFLAGKPTNVVN